MKKCAVAIAAALALLVLTPSAFAGTASIARALGPGVRVALHDDTGKVRFIGTTAGSPIARPQGFSASSSPAAVARAFLAQHAKLFGLRSVASDLSLVRIQAAGHGRSAVRFQQVIDGVPVLAGDLVVNLDAAENILSVSGETTPASVTTTPSVSAATAKGVATRSLTKPSLRGLHASRPQLWIYDHDLLGGRGPATPALVWRMNVKAPGRPDIRELVLVDATTGELVLHFNQVEQAKNRFICNANNTASKVPCTAPYARVEGQAATGVADVDNAYDFGGIVYDFYKNRFNRDSIDNKGMPLLQTVKYCDPSQPCPFANAFWNGNQMVYGDTYASADDVVGHEMTHGVTERTAGLFYYFQSGAINESLSDTMGELVDLTDGRGNDTAAARWLMGEDLPIGAIRSMKNPPAFGDPDSMTSGNYYQGLDDNGGVHTNSGVNNKAAFLITDGGTFNGQTVAGIGVDKAAAIYYEVDANLLTSGSDYEDLASALYQACQNLVGTVVNGSVVTQANCTNVQKATLAVRMTQQPTGVANVAEAPMCPAGQIPNDLFYDNFEAGLTKWTVTAPWQAATDYATSGKYILYATDQAVRGTWTAATKNPVAIPTGKTVYFRFSQFDDFESGFDSSFNFYDFDGGIVEYSTNGGATWSNAGPLFVDNGYFTHIAPSTVSDNPRAGEAAFGDTTAGFFSSRANLSTLGGQSVKLRFLMATDTGNVGNWFGWLVDDARVYTCATGSRPGGNATNMLRNPNFEWDDNDDSFPDFWSQNVGALRMAVNAHSGKYSLRSKAADPERFGTRQTVAGISAGQPYVLSAWVKAPATTSAVSMKIQVQWLNAAGAVLRTDLIKQYTDDTAGVWDQATGTNTSPAGTASARVVLFQDSLSGAPVYLDQVVFKHA